MLDTAIPFATELDAARSQMAFTLGFHIIWLIFVLVVLWTAFAEAFGSIFSTLFIPLSLAALGIVLRGSGFAFQRTARTQKGREVAERLPVSNAQGDPVTSWLNGVSLLIGALFVATCAYVAAVFLVSDARRAGAADLERYFTARALGAALVAGVLAIAGILVLSTDADYVYDRLTQEGLPLVILSGLCGLGVLVLLRRAAKRGARPLAVGAVVCVVWGWGVAEYPYLLPEKLKIADAAAPSATLTGVLIVFGAAVVLVLPSIALLFTLAQRSVIEETEAPR